MIDDLRSDDGLGGTESQTRHRVPPAEARPQGTAPLADREVPLVNGETEPRSLPSVVHDWLDGELPEASLRKGETARDVDFWRRIGEESERRRRTRTPVYLEAQIMAALPQTAPALITPWFRREFVVTPTKAVGTVVAAVAAGAIVTALLMNLTR